MKSVLNAEIKKIKKLLTNGFSDGILSELRLRYQKAAKKK